MNYPTHYSIEKIHTLDELKELFPDAKADALNWCLLSTSGIHGTGMTLSDFEELKEEYDKEGTPIRITVLVIMPRMVHIKYGHLEIQEKDIDYLRNLVKSSLEAIQLSQQGNII